MNETQHKILSQIRELLLEHFDAHVLVVEVDEVDDDRNSVQNGSFSGPRSRVIGMAEMVKQEILDIHSDTLRALREQDEDNH